MRLAAAVLLVLLPAVAFANMGKPPYTDGGFAREADRSDTGRGIESVIIQREDLRIDLRPLEHPDGRASSKVTAHYTINNPGAAIRTRLMFATILIRDSDFHVTIDNHPAELVRYRAGEDVGYWRGPDTTPLPGDDKLRLGLNRMADGIEFELVIPPGIHRIAVDYEPAIKADLGSSVLRWQFVYLLSPARDWKSLDTLNASLLIPKNWILAVTPNMRRVNDTLYAATWRGIPSDAIALTTYTPEPIGWDVYVYQILLFAATLVTAYVLGRLFGSSFVNADYSRHWRWLMAPLLAILLTWLYSLPYMWIHNIPRLRAGEQAVPPYGYGDLFNAIALGIGMWAGCWMAFTSGFMRNYTSELSDESEASRV